MFVYCKENVWCSVKTDYVLRWEVQEISVNLLSGLNIKLCVHTECTRFIIKYFSQELVNKMARIYNNKRSIWEGGRIICPVGRGLLDFVCAK